MANTSSGKLYITISDKRTSSGTPTSSTGLASGSDNSSDTESGSTSALGTYASMQLLNVAKKTTMQMVNYSLNNIGNLTGDYLAQTKVSVAKQAASGIMSVAQSTIGGLMATGGNPIGAVIGFAVGAVSLISSSVISEMTSVRENKTTNLELSQLRERAGLNATYDGSRGTEN